MKRYKWKAGEATSIVKTTDGTIVKSYAIRLPMGLWNRIEAEARRRNELRSRVIVQVLENNL